MNLEQMWREWPLFGVYARGAGLSAERAQERVHKQLEAAMACRAPRDTYGFEHDGRPKLARELTAPDQRRLRLMLEAEKHSIAELVRTSQGPSGGRW